MDKDYLDLIITGLLVPILPILASYVVALIKSHMKKLKSQTDSAITKESIDTLNEVIENVVKSLTQTTVKGLKKSQDGHLDGLQKEDILNMALEKVYKTINTSTYEVLQRRFDDIEEAIIDKIEAEVLKLKVNE